MNTRVRKPLWLTLTAVALILVWLGVGGIGGKQVGALSGLQKNDGSFLANDVESVVAATQAKAFQTSNALPLLIVIHGKDQAPTPAQLANVVRALPGTAVKTGGTLADVISGPVAPVPARDGKAALIQFSLDRDKATAKVQEKSVLGDVMHAVDEAVKPLRDAGFSVQKTGPAGFVDDVSHAFAGIDGILLVVALLVVLVILVAVYRSPFLPIAVLASAVFGLSAAALIVYPLAKTGVLTVSGQSQGILSILVVGAATDYALLLVARYREELHQHASVWDAMKAAWRGTVLPIVASGSTVVAGLLCLLLSDVTSTRSLGPIAALGIIGALLSSLTLLPAILLLGGRTMFWPSRPKLGDVDANHEGGWAKLAAWVSRRPRSVWLVTALALAVCSLGALVYRADGLSTEQFFRKDVESVQGNRALKEHFPGGQSPSLSMVVATDKAQRVSEAIAKVDGVDHVAPMMDRRNPTAPLVVADKQSLQVFTGLDAFGAKGRTFTKDVRAAAHSVDPDLKVGGFAADSTDSFAANQRDLGVVLPAILLVVFLVLVLVLRAFIAPLLLIGANILSFVATLGLSALVFNYVFKFANSEPSTPLYAFVFLIALGIDYSIFLMTRVREETPKHGTRRAVVLALALTGGVITSAGVVLAATFSALFVIPLVFMAQIAFFVAFGVLLDTFVVRSLLVPGLIHDIGRFSWWPSKLDAKARANSPEVQPETAAADTSAE